MKAIILTAPGGAENFKLADIATPQPESDEIRIRILAAGFNPADYKMRQTISADKLPLVLGGEVAGVVDAVGPKVSEFHTGDPVCAYLPLRRGGYAEAVCSHVAFVARKPDALSFSDAAAIPLAGLTALACVDSPMVRAQMPLFVAGGSGGVGSFVLGLARLKGTRPIITTAGGESSMTYLVEKLGMSMSEIVRYDQAAHRELKRSVCASNNGGLFPAVVDLVGEPMLKLCCDLVDLDGCVMSIVQRPDNEAQECLSSKSAAFRFISLRARAQSADVSAWTQYKTDLTKLLDFASRKQILLPKIENIGTLSVETVRAAHRLLSEKHVQGKLVMTTS